MIEPEAIYTGQWQEEVCTHGSEMPISVYASSIRYLVPPTPSAATQLDSQLATYVFPVRDPPYSPISQSNSKNMSEDQVTLRPVVAQSPVTEALKEEHDAVPEPIICPAFNDPTANVVLKSSDGVIFYVEDYYLKANRYVHVHVAKQLNGT
jgi:hypothetical protein